MAVRKSQQDIKKIPRSDFKLDKEENNGQVVGFKFKFLGDKKNYKKDHLVKIILSIPGAWQTYEIGKLEELTGEKIIKIQEHLVSKARVVLVNSTDSLKRFSAGSEEIDFIDENSGEAQEKIGILNVQHDDTLGNQLWDLKLTVNEGPVLLLNDAPEIDILNLMKKDKLFQASILPTVFGRILEEMVNLYKDGDLDDSNWVENWQDYFEQKCGVPEFKEFKDKDDDELKELVRSAVKQFSSEHKLVEALIAEIENG